MILKMINCTVKLKFALFMVVCTISVLLSGCKDSSENLAKNHEAPNIIYILADDLGYAELGCYGQEIIETKNLDLLAENGIRFTQHYSGAPVCAPSRCILLTGQHSGHAHIRGNDPWKERGDVGNYIKEVNDPNLEGQRPIPKSIPTIGNILQDQGYKTAIIGKWGLGAPLTDGIPINRGFDFSFGYNCQRQAHNLYPPFLRKNNQKILLKNELVVPSTKLNKDDDPYDQSSYSKYFQNEYAPALMQKEVLNFIDENSGGPFFIYYASPLPHAPLQVPQEYIDYYIDKLGDEEPYLGQKAYFPARNPRATYAAMVTYLDEQVGQIIQKLKDLGEYENTLIIFSSDNGPTYNGGTDSEFFDSAKPFLSSKGWGKGYLHEGGIRVPMIASWEGRISSGRISDHISAFWDVLPTLAEVAKAEMPANTDGISFLPEMLGEANQESHDHLYWEFPAYSGQQAVRRGNWKAIRKNILKGNMEIALYNLDSDIQEQHDVADQHPDIVAQMEQIMKDEHKPAEIVRFRMTQLGDIK